jgi:hypothetical protein
LLTAVAFAAFARKATMPPLPDMPYGRIVSFMDSATNSASLWYSKVGEHYLEHDNRKVYTHEK